MIVHWWGKKWPLRAHRPGIRLSRQNCMNMICPSALLIADRGRNAWWTHSASSHDLESHGKTTSGKSDPRLTNVEPG